MSPRRVEIRTHVGYGRRVEPDPTAHATDDPAAAHARWVQEQKRRNAVRGAEDIPADDPRWSRLAFFESIMVGVAERIAERKRVHVTLNGEPLEQVRARVRLRVAPDRPSDAQRLRFARRATKILARASSPFRAEAVTALTLFRQLVEEAKPSLTRADVLNLQDAFTQALARFAALHGPLTAEEMAAAAPT